MGALQAQAQQQHARHLIDERADNLLPPIEISPFYLAVGQSHVDYIVNLSTFFLSFSLWLLHYFQSVIARVT